MKHLSRLVILGVLSAAWTASPSARAAEPAHDKDGVAFFEKNIRPVLVKECYSCHATTAEKIRGSLKLDTRDGIRKGGDKGPAVVPGDLEKSLLLKAIKHDDDVKPMPPKKDKFADDVIADFEKWIAMGAPDPRGGPAKVDRCHRTYALLSTPWEAITAQRSWWRAPIFPLSGIPTLNLS